MISIDKEYFSEFVINKSRFLSYSYPVFDERMCKEILDKLNNQYSDATHICYAYVLSDPRVEKCSDNGEPSGTAGKPILELIKKKKLENVLVVVIRYFGGIKLGAGGLVRAYTNSANLSLNDCKIVEFIESVKYTSQIPTSIASKFVNSIESLGGKVLKIVYLDKANIEFACENVDKLKRIYKDIEIYEGGKEIICQ